MVDFVPATPPTNLVADTENATVVPKETPATTPAAIPKASLISYAVIIGFAVFVMMGLAHFIIETDPLKPHPIAVVQTIKGEGLKTIQAVSPYYLRAVRGDGKVEVRTGGTASWRFNNPAKLLAGSFAKRNGAIGTDGLLAIFPDAATGRTAAEKLLFEDPSLMNLSITKANAEFVISRAYYEMASWFIIIPVLWQIKPIIHLICIDWSYARILNLIALSAASV